MWRAQAVSLTQRSWPAPHMKLPKDLHHKKAAGNKSMLTHPLRKDRKNEQYAKNFTAVGVLQISIRMLEMMHAMDM